MVKHSLSSVWHTLTSQLYTTHTHTHTHNHRSKAVCYVCSILRYLHELQYFAFDKISIYESRKIFNIYICVSLLYQYRSRENESPSSKTLGVTVHERLIGHSEHFHGFTLCLKIFGEFWYRCTERWKDRHRKHQQRKTNSRCSRFSGVTFVFSRLCALQFFFFVFFFQTRRFRRSMLLVTVSLLLFTITRAWDMRQEGSTFQIGPVTSQVNIKVTASPTHLWIVLQLRSSEFYP